MHRLSRISNLLKTVLPAKGDVPVSGERQQRLETVWRELSGMEVGTAAARCRPLLFSSGRLVVFAESAAWGNEIRHRSRRLMSALSEHGVGVTSIEVKTQPLSPPPPPPKKLPPPVLSRKNAAQIESLAEDITDPQLKESLRRLARRGKKEGEE